MAVAVRKKRDSWRVLQSSLSLVAGNSSRVAAAATVEAMRDYGDDDAQIFSEQRERERERERCRRRDRRTGTRGARGSKKSEEVACNPLLEHSLYFLSFSRTPVPLTRSDLRQDIRLFLAHELLLHSPSRSLLALQAFHPHEHER